MGCNHEITKVTRRTIDGGRVIAAAQCQKCGSGKAVKMAGLDMAALPEFDKKIAGLYWEEESRAWKEKQAKILYQQITKTGEWWEKYQVYLSSPEWRKVREVVIERDKFCQRCLSDFSTQAHHLSYTTYNRHGFTFPAECVGVCESCHEQVHRRETE